MSAIAPIAFSLGIVGLAATGAFASPSPNICNRSDEVVSVAIAWWGDDNPGLHTAGWYTMNPGECQQPFPQDEAWGSGHRYYFAYSANHAWTGAPVRGPYFCTTPGARFEFETGDDCSAPSLKRSFIHINSVEYGSGDYRDADVGLTLQDATPGSLTWGDDIAPSNSAPGMNPGEILGCPSCPPRY